MVQANIAERVEDKMIEIHGKTYPKFILTRPDHLLFADKTGCNTDMTKDDSVGGERYGFRLLPNRIQYRYSFYCNPGTGEAVLCVIKFC